MKLKVYGKSLSGEVSVPTSKSYAHRAIIAAALADGKSLVDKINFSMDIKATIDAMVSLGAVISSNGELCEISGIKNTVKSCEIDCKESGSTLRFIIPIAAALGISCKFTGEGKLPTRPIDTYRRELSLHNIKFDCDGFPFEISGKLTGGEFKVEGNISSQFVTGLLYALPLCEMDSSIEILGKLESKPYVDMTIEILQKYGIEISESSNANGENLKYFIKGNQKYSPKNIEIEGDFSQAAFFYTANALGSNIQINGMNEKSIQGDKKTLEIIDEIGYNENMLNSFCVDASNFPDLVPILTVLASFCSDKCEITNIARLKIKESDRILAIADAINSIGGKVEPHADKLVIYPVKGFHSGIINGCNDHRIVMSAAIASTRSDGDIIITDAQAITKSYPSFWEDFKNLGGEFTEIL